MDIYRSAKFIFDRMLDHTTYSVFFCIFAKEFESRLFKLLIIKLKFWKNKKIKSIMGNVGGYHIYHRSSCICSQHLPFYISPFSMPSYNIWNFFHPRKVVGIHTWSQILFQCTHTHKRKHVHLVQHKWNLYKRIWS